MHSIDLAYRMFRNHLKSHLMYLAVLILAVGVHYEFVFLKYSPEFLEAQTLVQIARIASATTSFLMLLILFFFLFYSGSFFMKQRRKEIAIYALMGISNRKIGQMFALETLMTGGVAIAGGIGLGILFSRLFMMAVLKVAMLDATVSFVIPPEAIAEVAIAFGAMFLLMAMAQFITVVRSTLIDLIRDNSKEEPSPKHLIPKAVLSVLLIGAGYTFSHQIAMMVPVVVVVVMGTFWLFGALLPAVISRLAKRPAFLYKGVRLIGVGNMLFRIRSQYRALAMIAVMTAVTVTAFGTALSLRYYVDETLYRSCPYTFSWTSVNPDADQVAWEKIEASGLTVLYRESIRFLTIEDAELHWLNGIAMDVDMVRLSDFLRIQEQVSLLYPDYRFHMESMKGNQAILALSETTMGGTGIYSGKTLTVGGFELEIMQETLAPVFGKGSQFQTDAMVISDDVFDQLLPHGTLTSFHGVGLSERTGTQSLGGSLWEVLPRESKLFAYESYYQSDLQFYGLFFFLGAFMSVVFLLATGSILYFRTLSEALADREKYDVLMKIGLTTKELSRAVHLQVGLSMLVPLGVGIVHSVFAVASLSRLLSLNLNLPMIAAISIYVLCFSIIHLLTVRQFIRIVSLPTATLTVV